MLSYTGIQKLPQDWGFRIAGWGVINSILKRPGTLQDAAVDFLSDAICAAFVKQNFNRTKWQSQMCTTSLTGAGTCKGDSGGPLLLAKGMLSLLWADKHSNSCTYGTLLRFTPSLPLQSYHVSSSILDVVLHVRIIVFHPCVHSAEAGDWHTSCTRMTPSLPLLTSSSIAERMQPQSCGLICRIFMCVNR